MLRHTFMFRINGRDAVIKAKARVRDAKEAVELVVTAEDVRRSLSSDGVGNTQTCTMAVCALRHASKFAHNVQGYIDWQYSRAYVVSKVGADGLPSECFVYRHDSEIAKLNDSTGGQRRLLQMIERDGPLTVCMHPIKASARRKKAAYSKQYAERAGRTTGERSAKVAKRGAAARFAFASLGGI